MGKKPGKNGDEWQEAKRRCRLSDEEVRLAKELGFKPRSLIKNIPAKSQPWKAPVAEWIRDLHAKRFHDAGKPPTNQRSGGVALRQSASMPAEGKSMNDDAKNVKALATRKQDENHALRRYLKEQDRLSEEELDQLVSDIARRVWASFDCTTCANCCKQLGRSVTDREVQRLATDLRLSEEDFRSRYLEGHVAEEEDDEGSDQKIARWRMRGKPCPFLKDNKCTVYEARPEQCRKYPYLYEPAFSSRTLGMIERTLTCSVVYLVFEKLKEELPFRQQGRGWESW